MDQTSGKPNHDGPPAAAPREALGEVVAACELRQRSRQGIPGRPHHYCGVLRDHIGNLWACDHQHADQDEAQSCARDEFDRRVAAGEIKTRRRRPVGGNPGIKPGEAGF